MPYPVQPPKVVVKKFGGTSVGSLDHMHRVAKRVYNDSQLPGAPRPIVVVSAQAGETDRLLSLGAAVNSAHKGRAYDMLLATGEQVSVALLAMAFERLGVRAVPLLAYQLGIRTDGQSARARIKSIDTSKIWVALDQGAVPVVAGFQGVSGEGDLTTLGRGGSDTTAVALSVALGAELCEIYTDVAAVYTSNPSVVPLARPIKKIGMSEMMEMAFLGSRVLHYRCVEVAAKYGVNIHLRSTFTKEPGTLVMADKGLIESPVITAISFEEYTHIIKLHPLPLGVEVLADLFAALAEQSLVVDIITQTHTPQGQRLAFSVEATDSAQVQQVVESFVKPPTQVELVQDVAKLSAVGMGMKHHAGVAARFFQILKQESVDVHLVTTSDIKISVVMDRKCLKQAARALHREFIEQQLPLPKR